MNTLVEIVISSGNMIFDHANMFLSSLPAYENGMAASTIGSATSTTLSTSLQSIRRNG